MFVGFVWLILIFLLKPVAHDLLIAPCPRGGTPAAYFTLPAFGGFLRFVWPEHLAELCCVDGL